jgi:hypothetical protein
MLALEQLFPIGCFGTDDFWLRPRVLGLLQKIFALPHVCFSQLSTDASFVKGAYRLCEHPEMSLERLLSPAFEQVADSLRQGALGPTALCIQDTTELDLSHLPGTTGLGELRIASRRGIHLHPALVLSTTGVPLGLLGVKTFVRDPAEHGKRQRRGERRFEEKESYLWWEMVERTEGLVNAPGRLLTVGDRGMDVLDVLARGSLSGYRLLLRAAQDRWVNDFVEDYACATLFETVLATRARGTRQIHLPAQAARGKQPARAERMATLHLRFTSVVLRVKDVPAQRVPVWAIHVAEDSAEEVVTPVEWMLLTTEPIETAADAWERVRWYLLRWRIEEFFKVLKTGCRAEARQFESRESYENALALLLVAAVRILSLRDRAREQPEMPASVVFNEVELEVLKANAQQAREPLDETPSMRQAVRWMARMGGFLGRKSDGEPGWLTIWRGYLVLCAMVDGYLLARGEPPQQRYRPPPPLSLPDGARFLAPSPPS